MEMPTSRNRPTVMSRASRRPSLAFCQRWLCSRIASMIWSPTVCTGLKAAIGSCGISAISPPRMSRITAPRGGSWAMSMTSPSAPFDDVRRKRISPAVMRPGLSTSCRIARMVTLLPQPDSPTTPSTWPGMTSKLVPSTARTRPSSRANETLRSRTESRGAWLELTAASMAVGVGGVAQAVPHQVEGEHGHDDDQAGNEQPGRQRQRLDVLRLLQEHAPADGGRADAETEEGERGLVDDHHRDGERAGGDDVAQERRHHVAQDDAHPRAAGEPRGQHEVLLAQRQEAAAHFAAKRRPADQRQDHGDGEEHLDRRPVARQGGGQREPDRDGGHRLQELDQALDHLVDEAAEIAGDAAKYHAEDDAERDGNETDGHRRLRAAHDA